MQVVYLIQKNETDLVDLHFRVCLVILRVKKETRETQALRWVNFFCSQVLILKKEVVEM